MEALVVLLAMLGMLLYLIFVGLSFVLPRRFLGHVMAIAFYNLLKWLFLLPFRLLRGRKSP